MLYNNITKDELDKLRQDLATEGVVVPEGNDVIIKAPHGIELRGIYNAVDQTLNISIVKKPFFVPESRIWEVIDTGIKPYTSNNLLVALPNKRHKLFRFALRKHMQANGYTSEQANRIVGQLGDGQILEWIKKWGPLLLKILVAILPLLLAMEPPHGVPVGSRDVNDETEIGEDD
jgi:hypothetical protein